MRKNLDEYYEKIGKVKKKPIDSIETPLFEKKIGNEFEEFLQNEKLKVKSKIDETSTSPSSSSNKSDEPKVMFVEKKFSMSLKSQNSLKLSKPIIKSNIFHDETEEPTIPILTEKEDKCDEKSIVKPKIDEKKKIDKSRVHYRRSRSSSSKRSPIRERSRDRHYSQQRRGERGERKKNIDDLTPPKDRPNYDFSNNFQHFGKKTDNDRKLNEMDAAKCSQLLTDYMNPNFYAPLPPPTPSIDDPTKFKWNSLDDRLESIKNDNQQNFISVNYQYNEYSAVNYPQAVAKNYYNNLYNYPVEENPNLISIKSQDLNSSYVLNGNVLEIVPTQIQPPLPSVVTPPLPPPPPPPPLPPVKTESKKLIQKRKKKLLAKEEKIAARRIRIESYKQEIREILQERENNLRLEIERELIPIGTIRSSILLDRTVTEIDDFDVCRSFKEEKALRGERAEKSVIYGDFVKPNYDEDELKAQIQYECDWLSKECKRLNALDKLKEIEDEEAKVCGFFGFFLIFFIYFFF